MSVETTGLGALLLVLVMAGVTLATRWGGVYVMSFVPLGARVRPLHQRHVRFGAGGAAGTAGAGR